jgi:hypothetical protein
VAANQGLCRYAASPVSPLTISVVRAPNYAVPVAASLNRFNCYSAMLQFRRPNATWVLNRIWCTRRTIRLN